MDQTQLATLLDRLAGRLTPASGATDAHLKQLRRELARALRLQPVDELMPGGLGLPELIDPEPQAGSPLSGEPSAESMTIAGAELATPVPPAPERRVFRRDVPAVTTRRAGSTPAWAAGQRIDKTLGPFIDHTGKTYWFDFFRPVPFMRIMRGADVILLVRLPGGLTPADVYELDAGTVWIKSRLLAAAAPAGSFSGLRIRKGRLVFRTSVAPAGGTIALGPADECELELRLDPPAPTPAADTATGDDAETGTAQPPKDAHIILEAAGATVAEAGEMRARVFGRNYPLPHHRPAGGVRAAPEQHPGEFAEPVQNPKDDYFAFVKAYAPDPMLLSDQQPLDYPKEEMPYVPPESIRVITKAQSDDRAGLNAWQRLIPSGDESPRHFMVPLPPGVNGESHELFGFFVYEFCVGHARVWSTAQGRFGRQIRLTGVQHPAPALVCTVTRTPNAVMAFAPFAMPAHEGRSLLPRSPETELWGVLYTQVLQADGQDHRNILLGHRRMQPDERSLAMSGSALRTPEITGRCGWSQTEIESMLQSLRLRGDAPLSVIAVEILPNGEPVAEPLGAELGQQRIYRTSRLQPVPMIC